MKLQFGVTQILLATAVVAIAFGGTIAAIHIQGHLQDTDLFRYMVVVFSVHGAFFLPMIFVAFAIGRKALTVPMVVALVIGEALAVGLVHWSSTWVWLHAK